MLTTSKSYTNGAYTALMNSGEAFVKYSEVATECIRIMGRQYKDSAEREKKVLLLDPSSYPEAREVALAAERMIRKGLEDQIDAVNNTVALIRAVLEYASISVAAVTDVRRTDLWNVVADEIRNFAVEKAVGLVVGQITGLNLIYEAMILTSNILSQRRNLVEAADNFQAEYTTYDEVLYMWMGALLAFEEGIRSGREHYFNRIVAPNVHLLQTATDDVA